MMKALPRTCLGLSVPQRRHKHPGLAWVARAIEITHNQLNTMTQELTPEQEAKIPEYYAKWLEVATNTDECDYDRAKEGARLSYSLQGLKCPENFYLVDGPQESISLLQELYGCTRDQAISAHLPGSFAGTMLGFYDFIDKELGVKEAQKLYGLMEVAKASGWWAPLEDAVIFQHRPLQIHVNDTPVLDCMTGPAVEFRDGFKVYCVDDVLVPGWAIEDPGSITVAAIEQERNAEVALVLRQLYGEARYLGDIGAKVLAVDSVPCESWNPESKVIFRALMEDKQKRRFLVGPDGSTRDRTFVMRVPSSVQNCVEAERALTGLDPSKQLGRS